MCLGSALVFSPEAVQEDRLIAVAGSQPALAALDIGAVCRVSAALPKYSL